MTTPARIGLYLAGLGVTFLASAVIADAVVPEATVESWNQSVDDAGHGDTGHRS